MDTKYVFVDFFNTIIRRNASPQDVIFYFTKKLGNKYSIEPSSIYKIFMKCKNHLTVEKFWSTGESEYRFEEVMTQTALLVSKIAPINPKEFETDGLNCYIQAEAESMSVKEETISLIKQYRKNGAIKVFVVSDFYCSKDVLAVWLNKFDILNLFDDIFVSCDYGKSKRTGKLYKAILSEQKINPSEAIMIGDSYSSDCKNALLHGMSYKHLKELQPKRSKNCVNKGANYLQLKEIFDSCPDFRYSNYAFTLYLFTKRLCERLEQSNIKDVFFLAREGQFLKLLFEKYCNLTGKGQNLRTHYLYVSRNSVLPASLKPLDEETFDKVFPGVLCVTLRKFLTTLGFSKQDTEIIAKQVGTSPDKIYADMPKSKMFKQLRKNKYFVEKYNNLLKTQNNNFRAYMESFGVDLYGNTVAVVDVGWAGTMQTLMDRHFHGEVNFVGYYVGARDSTPKDRTCKFGLLYARKNNRYKHSHMYRHHMTYYEQLLRADHNRTDGYEIVDGIAKPVLDAKINENEIFKRDIEPLQKEIAIKFEKICQLDYDYCSTMDDVVARAFYKMSINHTKKDTQWIMRCEDSLYDNYMRIGYTFTPFKHWMRVLVHGVENIFFCIKYANSTKIHIVTNATKQESQNSALQTATER